MLLFSFVDLVISAYFCLPHFFPWVVLIEHCVWFYLLSLFRILIILLFLFLAVALGFAIYVHLELIQVQFKITLIPSHPLYYSFYHSFYLYISICNQIYIYIYTHTYKIKCIVILFWTKCYVRSIHNKKSEGFYFILHIFQCSFFLYVDPSFWSISFSFSLKNF